MQFKTKLTFLHHHFQKVTSYEAHGNTFICVHMDVFSFEQMLALCIYGQQETISTHRRAGIKIKMFQIKGCNASNNKKAIIVTKKVY